MIENTEVRAFPSALAEEVRAVLPQLTAGQLHPPKGSFQVRVRGETMDIPCRVYYSVSQLLDCVNRPGVQGRIALCLGTRHHNGYVREKCLKRLIESEEPWVVPFIPSPQLSHHVRRSPTQRSTLANIATIGGILISSI